MILIWTCWCLCVMFLVMLGCASAITVAPGSENTMAIIMLALLILSVILGIVAICLHRKIRRSPKAFIFRSKIVSRISIGFAVALLIFLLFEAIG